MVRNKTNFWKMINNKLAGLNIVSFKKMIYVFGRQSGREEREDT